MFLSFSITELYFCSYVLTKSEARCSYKLCSHEKKSVVSCTVEYKQLSMCTQSVQFCLAWPKPKTRMETEAKSNMASPKPNKKADSHNSCSGIILISPSLSQISFIPSWQSFSSHDRKFLPVTQIIFLYQ